MGSSCFEKFTTSKSDTNQLNSDMSIHDESKRLFRFV